MKKDCIKLPGDLIAVPNSIKPGEYIVKKSINDATPEEWDALHKKIDETLPGGMIPVSNKEMEMLTKSNEKKEKSTRRVLRDKFRSDINKLARQAKENYDRLQRDVVDYKEEASIKRAVQEHADNVKKAVEYTCLGIKPSEEGLTGVYGKDINMLTDKLLKQAEKYDELSTVYCKALQKQQLIEDKFRETNNRLMGAESLLKELGFKYNRLLESYSKE